MIELGKCLFISPHSDDAELGCGGLIARQVEREGPHAVSVLVVCTQDERQLHAEGMVSGLARSQEFYRAMGVLGVRTGHSKILYANMNAEFDICNLGPSEIIQELDNVIEEEKPTSVFLPLPSFHQEHALVYRLGLAATRPTKHGNSVANVFAYEYPGAHWGESSAFDHGAVRFRIAAKYMEMKQKALSMHESQMYRGEGSLISHDSVTTLAQMRGLESNCEFAELMYLLRGVA